MLSYIDIEILADILPETDEDILLRLNSVSPENQKIRPTSAEKIIRILENDNPGGVFQFSADVNRS